MVEVRRGTLLLPPQLLLFPLRTIIITNVDNDTDNDEHDNRDKNATKRCVSRLFHPFTN